MQKLFITVGMVLSLTAPAYALEVTKSATIPAAPDKVWQTIGDFCGIGNWHPAIEKCVLADKSGKTQRTLSLKGGGTILEEQVVRDDKGMSYTYKIVESPLPVDNYVSTIVVTPEGSGSNVSWKGKFDAKGAPDAKAEEVIGGIYDAGFKGIAGKVK